MTDRETRPLFGQFWWQIGRNPPSSPLTAHAQPWSQGLHRPEGATVGRAMSVSPPVHLCQPATVVMCVRVQRDEREDHGYESGKTCVAALSPERFSPLVSHWEPRPSARCPVQCHGRAIEILFVLSVSLLVPFASLRFVFYFHYFSPSFRQLPPPSLSLFFLSFIHSSLTSPSVLLFFCCCLLLPH